MLVLLKNSGTKSYNIDPTKTYIEAGLFVNPQGFVSYNVSKISTNSMNQKQMTTLTGIRSAKRLIIYASTQRFLGIARALLRLGNPWANVPF